MCQCRTDVDPARVAARRAANLAKRVDAGPRRILPRQIPPTRLWAEYGNALDRALVPVFSAYHDVLIEVPAILAARPVEAEHESVRLDGDVSKRVRAALTAAGKRARDAVKQPQIEALAEKFATRTSTYQRIQLKRQLHAALGVDPLIKDPGLAAATDDFVRDNVALIKRIPEALHGDVEKLVNDAVSSSKRSPKLADHIQARFGISKRHARLIARDQISKHSSKLNHKRQKDLGIEKFSWDSCQDERVRDWHRDELDGNVYKFDNPPLNEDGEQVLPGDDVQCRCSADPLVD